MVRLEHPDKPTIDYTLTLDGFKELGELCIALHDFCKKPIFLKTANVNELKKLLTRENIKKRSNFSTEIQKKVVSKRIA
jgi:hypothetical protein